jgi:hypothetical protein
MPLVSAAGRLFEGTTRMCDESNRNLNVGISRLAAATNRYAV